MSISLVILADDLTGTADTAARCFQAGMDATIFLRPPRSVSGQGAVALTSDSRHLTSEEADRSVRRLLAHITIPIGVTLYKKIDSTLRGQIGAELNAMLETLSLNCALICPAFPAQDRGLRDGYLVYADTPDGTVHLPAILAKQTDLPIGELGLPDVRRGAVHLASRIRVELAAGARLLVGDAMTEADLDCLLAAVRMAAPTALLCGSAGLAGVLARSMAPESAHGAPGRLESLPVCDRILVVVGSGSPVARRQIGALGSGSNVEVFELTEDLFGDGLPERITGRHWLLHLPEPAPDARLDGPEARELAAKLADTTMAAIARLLPNALVLVGGDTALHVLTALHVEELAVRCELAPGIPLLRVDSATDRALAVVLKAGNHGDERALVEIVGKLAGTVPA